MAPSAKATHSRPGRSLAVLGALLALIFGLIASGVAWSDAQWMPKLALDLEGGTEMILEPVPNEGQTDQKFSPESIREAVNIIRQRVNGSGVTEAEVTSDNDQNIIVALPGRVDAKTRDLIKQSAQLQFRAVLIAENAAVPQTSASPSPSASGKTGDTKDADKASAEKAGDAKKDDKASPEASASASPDAAENNAVMPASIRALAGLKAAKDDGKAADDTKDDKGAEPTPSASPKDASDLAWVTPALRKQFDALDCTDEKNLQGGRTFDPAKPMVACSKDGDEKYILGPAEVLGKEIERATSGLGTNSQGASTGQWEVNLEFSSKGTRQFADVTTRLAAVTQGEARNRFGIVLDGLVISAPGTEERIAAGQARISGSFTQSSATMLANQLKFGALPMSFSASTENEISASLGEEQLQRGLLAGLIGLILVVIYSLFQYRALGTVTVLSLGIAGAITYGLVVLLGHYQGYRLSLPGIAGLIVAIGITADSFIVFFERVKDEIREGWAVQSAVEVAWHRARRTILASDAVSFLAALVLYLLAVGGVKGFAFTLGLTTVIDVLVVFLFTKPVVTLMARTRFFGEGHKLSGFDAVALNRTPAYAGRGKVRSGGTIAERRAAADTNGTAGRSANAATSDSTQGSRQPAGTGRDA